MSLKFRAAVILSNNSFRKDGNSDEGVSTSVKPIYTVTKCNQFEGMGTDDSKVPFAACVQECVIYAKLLGQRQKRNQQSF
jgi:hypothetical protein